MKIIDVEVGSGTDWKRITFYRLRKLAAVEQQEKPEAAAATAKMRDSVERYFETLLRRIEATDRPLTPWEAQCFLLAL
jgi:hypothetical protein